MMILRVSSNQKTNKQTKNMNTEQKVWVTRLGWVLLLCLLVLIVAFYSRAFYKSIFFCNDKEECVEKEECPETAKPACVPIVPSTLVPLSHQVLCPPPPLESNGFVVTLHDDIASSSSVNKSSGGILALESKDPNRCSLDDLIRRCHNPNDTKTKALTSTDDVDSKEESSSLSFVTRTFTGDAITGLALSADTTPELLNEFKAHPLVKSVEPDIRVRSQPIVLPPVNASAGQVSGWHIARVGANQSSTISGNGSGVVGTTHVFVLDTGITPHADLTSLVTSESKSFVPGQPSSLDGHDHGTFCASLVCANDNSTGMVGASPGVPIHSVRVLDANGSGQLSTIIAGLEFVIAWKKAHPSIPVVISMSLGAEVGVTTANAMDLAATKAVNNGIVVCVAAGNSGRDAKLTSPAHATGVICVGSYNQSNRISSFSNGGSTVTLCAPGENIVSFGRNGTLTTMSGTSMSTPIVAATAALLLSQEPNLTPAQVKSRLISAATSATTSTPAVPATPYQPPIPAVPAAPGVPAVPAKSLSLSGGIAGTPLKSVWVGNF